MGISLRILMQNCIYIYLLFPDYLFHMFQFITKELK
jgi:hypothetical protein